MRITVEGRHLLLTALANNLLCLVDLTTSLHCGSMVDVHGSQVASSHSLGDFAGRVRALPYTEARADQHELLTHGGETLELTFDERNAAYLLSGWVVARIASAGAFCWFPIDRCVYDPCL